MLALTVSEAAGGGGELAVTGGVIAIAIGAEVVGSMGGEVEEEEADAGLNG